MARLGTMGQGRDTERDKREPSFKQHRASQPAVQDGFQAHQLLVRACCQQGAPAASIGLCAVQLLLLCRSGQLSATLGLARRVAALLPVRTALLQCWIAQHADGSTFSFGNMA